MFYANVDDVFSGGKLSLWMEIMRVGSLSAESFRRLSAVASFHGCNSGFSSWMDLF